MVKIKKLNKLSFHLAFVSLFLTSLVVCGWIFQIPLLKSIRPEWITLKMNTAIMVMMLAFALLFLKRSIAGTQAAFGISFLILLAGVVSLSRSIFGLDLVAGKGFPLNEMLWFNGKITIVNAANLTLMSLAIMSAASSRYFMQVITHIFALLALMINAAIFMGYIYGLDAVSSVESPASASIISAVIFIFLAVSVISACGNIGLPALLCRDRIGSLMARNLIPLAVLVPFVLGWIVLTLFKKNYVEDNLATAIMVTSIVIIFLLGIWRATLKLNALDEIKNLAEKSLQDSLVNLEKRVAERTKELSIANESLKLQKEINAYINSSPGQKVINPQLLEIICRQLNWHYAGYWEMDEKTKSLIFKDYWSVNCDKIGEFITASHQFTFLKGEGLPGKVWLEMKPLTTSAEGHGPVLRRSELAARCGLKGGFAFPIYSDDNFYGIIEVASDAGPNPTKITLDVCKDAGTLIGNHIKRKQVETLLEEQKLKLIQAAKMSALGEMAGGIAHEINTPLNIITLSSNLVKENLEKRKVLDAESEYLIGRIEGTAFRIAKIVKGLRWFAKESGGDECEIISFNIIVNETLSLCQEKFKNHGVQLRLISVPDDLMVACRPTEISQVLLNLLNNAFDAIQDQDDKWIEINVKENDNGLQISVVDSGFGIDPAIQNKIMQPFFTTKSLGKGMGLGLSLSKGIIESHKGMLSLDVSSHNTCFVIDLPKGQISHLDA